MTVPQFDRYHVERLLDRLVLLKVSVGGFEDSIGISIEGSNQFQFVHRTNLRELDGL